MTMGLSARNAHAVRALGIASLASLALATAKLYAFVLSGSLSALASAFDSLSDALLSAANRGASQIAARGADRHHPFGHGGFEVLGSLVQGIILLGMAGFVFFQSWQRFSDQAGHDAIILATQELPVAIAILLVSATSAFVIGRLLQNARAKNQHRSLALDADRAHYAGDTAVNIFAAIGIALSWHFNDARWDAGFALLGGVYLLRSALPVLSRVAGDILQKEADKSIQQRVVDAARSVDGKILGLHRLRTRESGPTLFVDFHLVLPAALPLGEAHEIGERAMRAVRKACPGADVLVHLDPDTEPPEADFRD